MIKIYKTDLEGVFIDLEGTGYELAESKNKKDDCIVDKIEEFIRSRKISSRRDISRKFGIKIDDVNRKLNILLGFECIDSKYIDAENGRKMEVFYYVK